MAGNYIMRRGKSQISDLIDDTAFGRVVYLDTVNGRDGNGGTKWSDAVQTMSRALTLAETGSKVYFVGDVREQLVGSNLKFDISIIGAGSLHHPDLPAAGYHPGASCWRAPASPASTTPLLEVRGRGWKFENIMFDGPADAACVKLTRNSSSGTSEYDASHATFYNCDFRNGLYGIHSFDGIFNLTIERCVFETFDATTSGAAIIDSINTGVAAPRRWRIIDNFFQTDSTTEGNERHIVAGIVGSLLKGNVFGTVKGTGKYIDFTGGSGNVVFNNLLMGAYDTSDYVPGTGDSWAGNKSLSASFGGNDAYGNTFTAPAAAT